MDGEFRSNIQYIFQEERSVLQILEWSFNEKFCDWQNLIWSQLIPNNCILCQKMITRSLRAVVKSLPLIL